MSEVFDAPSVAAVFINFMNASQTINCLENFVRFTAAVQLVVIDNSPITQQCLREYCQSESITFIATPENRGYAAAANVGITHVMSTGPAQYVAVLNTDILIDEGAFFEVVNVMQSDVDIFVAGPVINDLVDEKRTDRVQSAGQSLARFTGKARPVTTSNKAVYEVPYVSGAALFVKAEAFTRVGLLVEDFFLYYEETEFCYRLRRKVPGAKVVVVRDAVMWHQQGAVTTSKIASYYGIRSRIMFYKKSFPGRLPSVVVYAIFSTFLSVFREGSNKGPMLHFRLKGIIDGLRGLKGKTDFG